MNRITVKLSETELQDLILDYETKYSRALNGGEIYHRRSG